MTDWLQWRDGTLATTDTEQDTQSFPPFRLGEKANTGEDIHLASGLGPSDPPCRALLEQSRSPGTFPSHLLCRHGRG